MRHTTYILILAVLITGCASSTPHKTPSEEAKLKWDQARASVLVSLAQDQYTSGNLDKCKETVNEALRMDPTNPQLHLLTAKLSIEKGDLEVAERSLDRVRQLDAKNAEADYLSGVIYQRWQRTETAASYYKSASEKAPAELAYLMARAEMLVALGQQDKALSLLMEHVQYFEHSGAIRDAAGQLLVQSGKLDEGIDMLRQASILADDDNTVREHLGLALYQAKRYPEATDVIGRLVALDSYSQRSDLFAALGECQLQSGKFRDARASFESATQIDSSSPTIWLGFSKAAIAMSDLTRAELAVKKAISLDPRSSAGNLLLGYVKVKQEKWNDALTAFARAYELDPHDTTGLCMTGFVLEKQGHSDQAMKYYAKALQINPGDDMANRMMAAVDKD